MRDAQEQLSLHTGKKAEPAQQDLFPFSAKFN